MRGLLLTCREEGTLRALLVLTLAGCLVASGAAFGGTSSTRSQSQASTTIAKAKSAQRVQGTIPAGSARIQSKRKVRASNARRCARPRASSPASRTAATRCS